MLNIRPAAQSEYQKVKIFYHSLIDAMEHSPFHPGWEKEVYPSSKYLRDSIEMSQLYLGESEGSLASCMIVNHRYNDGYRKLSWSVEADDSMLLVIHALGVHPSFSGRGFAREMVDYAIDLAKRQGLLTLRLDILEGNLPAERAYTKAGFQYVGTVPMYYEDTGWTNYKAFEYILSPKNKPFLKGSPEIRPYQPSDCQDVTRLFYNTVHTINAKDYSPDQLEAWADGHPDLEAWNRSLMSHYSLVAVWESQIIGFGDIDQSRSYLDRLYVHKDFQGLGVASALCDRLEAAAADPITTHTSITARPFFEKRGYAVVKEQQVERKGIHLTNFIMEKPFFR